MRSTFQLLMCLLVSNLSMRVNIFFKYTMSSTTIRFNIVTTVIKMLVRVDPDETSRPRQSSCGTTGGGPAAARREGREGVG